MHPCPLLPCSTPRAPACSSLGGSGEGRLPLPPCLCLPALSSILDCLPFLSQPGYSAPLPAALRSCISGTNPLFLFLPSPLPCTGSIQYQEPWWPAALCLSWSTLRAAKTPRATPETTAMTTTSASARQGYVAAPSSLPPQERGESGRAQGKAFPTPLREPGRPSRGFKAQSHTAAPSECNNWSSCCLLPLDGLTQPSRGRRWLPVTTSLTPSEGVSPPVDAGR